MITNFLNALSLKQITILCYALVIGVGIADYFAGPELSSSIFYVIPISISAWNGNKKLAVSILILSATAWLLTDILSGRQYSHPFILYWNGSVRLGLFMIISYLFSGYREQLNLEEKLADTDPLTGAYNRRAFLEFVDLEIHRARRFNHMFSFAYIDLDNFKQVNDTLGHSVGDALLKKVFEIMRLNTRKTDVIGRLGGDEFALLLVETGGQSSKETLEKLQSLLLNEMQQEKWPVTFSIGVVTCEKAPRDVLQVIDFADELMYSVKKSGKNRIAHAILEKT